MIKKKNIKFMLIAVAVIGLCVFIKASAINEFVIPVESEFCDMRVEEYNNHDGYREISVFVNDITAGKRFSTFEYCEYDEGNNTCGEWQDVNGYQNNYASSFANSVGSDDMFFDLKVPDTKVKFRAVFEDFEPMNISYALFNDEDLVEYNYVDKAKSLNNYTLPFAPIITGYRGGDIVLPSDCTDQGCLLKVTMSSDDYDAYNDRLTAENNRPNAETKELVDVASMNNHLDEIGLYGDSLAIYKVGEDPEHQQIYYESDNSTTSFYLVVSKYFYGKNRSEFVVGDNKNRILSEDYIGLKYKVDRKYFDEGNNYGFLTFNDYNDYKQEATIFYGTPLVQFEVDDYITPVGTQVNVGELKYSYNSIVSRDNRFPINNNFELLIDSFYEQDYTIPMTLKGPNGDKNIELNFSRFAFGGNAGGLLPVDGNGNNCRDAGSNPDCTEGNIYVSTRYRGLFDTFYSTGNSTQKNIVSISMQHQGLTADAATNVTVYERNLDFNPWAVAIFYHDDQVVATKSFDLGELVKVEGISDVVIPNSAMVGAKTFGGDPFGDYDSDYYVQNGYLFGYGLGFEQSMNTIKYFSEGSYNSNIDQTLILASKEEIIDNDINRIALFLTNGELKSDEQNFPKLKYGVGEGKVFYIDNRTFDRIGGN